MGRLFYCKLEFEERSTPRTPADEERDRQIALLSSAVMRLEAGQAQLAVVLMELLASSTADSDEEQIRKGTRQAAIERLTRLRQGNEAFIREFNKEFDRAERAKQQIETEYQLRRLRRLAGERV